MKKLMKKIVLIIMVFVVMLTGVNGNGLHTMAADKYIESGEYIYIILDNGTVKITKYMGEGKNVNIPSQIDGKNVTSIGVRAFYCNTNLTSITIPNNITSILTEAFYNCPRLNSITIPRQVVTIGDGAFSYQWDEDTLSEEKVFGFKIYCTEDSLGKKFAINNKMDYVIPLSDVNISLSKINYTYNGIEKKPEVTVVSGKTTLVQDHDYQVKYYDNTNIGTAILIIKGKGKYSGTIIKTFTISPSNIPKKNKIINIVSPKYKRIKVTWKKDKNATGYEIQYSTSKKFKHNIEVTLIQKNIITTKKFTGLKRNTRYYIRARSYKLQNSVKNYGDWSAKKSVRCK